MSTAKIVEIRTFERDGEAVVLAKDEDGRFYRYSGVNLASLLLSPRGESAPVADMRFPAEIPAKDKD